MEWKEAAQEINRQLSADGASAINVDRAVLDAIVKPPDQATSNAMWRWLVPGLLLLALVSVGALAYAILDGNDQTPPDALLTVFTTVFAGLLALFVKTPST